MNHNLSCQYMQINCESTVGHTFSSLQLLTHNHNIIPSLITYKNGKKRNDRQYKLLMDNGFELNVNRFHVLLIISSINGDKLSIINVMNITKIEKYNVKSTEQTLGLISNNFEHYVSKNKSLSSNVNSHPIIKQIESNLFSLCDSNKRNNDKYIAMFDDTQMNVFVIHKLKSNTRRKY